MIINFPTESFGANSNDLDQTAPRGAVLLGSSLFAILFTIFCRHYSMDMDLMVILAIFQLFKN